MPMNSLSHSIHLNNRLTVVTRCQGINKSINYSRAVTEIYSICHRFLLLQIIILVLVRPFLTPTNWYLTPRNRLQGSKCHLIIFNCNKIPRIAPFPNVPFNYLRYTYICSKSSPPLLSWSSLLKYYCPHAPLKHTE